MRTRLSDLTDHYAVLEVTPAATDEEIDVAYRRLIRAWHPDNYPVDAPREIHELAEERTKLLIQARQELRDPQRRRAFDERRSAVVSEDGRPAPETTAAPPSPDQVGFGASSAAATGPSGDVDAAAEPPWGVSGTGRLVAWFVLAGLIAAAGIAVGLANIQSTGGEAYQFAPSISAIVFSALMLGLVLWIAPGIRVRDVLTLRPVLTRPRALLGLHRPRKWRWALGASGAVVVASFAFILLFDAVFGPFEGDDRVPTFWDGSRAPQFALSFLVVAVLVPIGYVVEPAASTRE